MTEAAQAPRCGVLLINLGTPAAPTAAAIRRFLREFLLDRRVVNIPRLIWWPLLFGLILPFRGRALAHKYASIWTPQGSPLLVISREQRQALARILPEHSVALAMRYGQPSIAAGLKNLLQAGVKRVLALPLYPQYSESTTASSLAAVAAHLRRAGAPAELRCIKDYHDDDGYVAALAASVRRHWQENGRGGKLLMSFHGLPQSFVDQGDPYSRQCETTAKLLAQSLGLKDQDWVLSYQSRLGRARWLQPYTDATVSGLARQGVQTLDVICPGFAADCLETLEEIAQQNRAIFRAAGGEELRYIPALNAGPEHIAALAGLIRRHTQSWD
ncbi:MAG: ferrochelatase [Nevskiales bacterium]